MVILFSVFGSGIFLDMAGSPVASPKLSSDGSGFGGDSLCVVVVLVGLSAGHLIPNPHLWCSWRGGSFQKVLCGCVMTMALTRVQGGGEGGRGGSEGTAGLTESAADWAPGTERVKESR